MAYTSKHGVDDMVMLSKISNDGITENLKKRHEHDIIYAYIGHVLISVNPFKEIKGLYSDRLLKDYKGKYRYELPPHVYSLADDMYRTLINERYNQCVIISGESGAGKTEASKKIMQFIASVAGNSPNVQHVKDVILQSNPLLEAFGNAKTLRNNNSSRFGKYMEIQFDIAGEPEGGRINNYLLEKSRVVTRSNGERCFHIFYQLLAGADSNMQSELGLQGPDYYLYLAQSRCTQIDGTDDRAEFKDTTEAMGVMNIDKSFQFEVFRLLAAILYLGNVAFYDGGKDQAAIQDKQVVEMFAYLLQSDAQSCVKSMCFRTISTGTQGKSARVSTYACPQNVEGALYSRDALAKALYSRLFDWIIAKVNTALGWAADQDCLVLGILDIYGFEIFEKNGFEQFCINYVNEKLQQIFIELTLKAEQEEYGKEGIKWEHIDFFNNKICCDLIELKKPIGMLALLDDTCNFPKGTDDKFLQRLCESFPDHPHFQGGLGAGTFIIKHYAGDVTYNVEGFCDRNRDLLFNDLIDLAHCTKSQLVQSLFPEAKTVADKRRPTTAGFKIKESINLLVNALQLCNPHYIRCIKPNENKRANDFNFDMVNHQVKYLGLLENVRVRRAGYAYRHPYDKFFYRYRVCSNQTWPNWNGDFVGGTEAILQVLNLGQGEYQKGKTKIFIRKPETVFSLEELRERKVFSYANQIQRFFMKFSLHNYYYQIQMNGNQKLQNNKERRRASIERNFKGDYIGYRENFPLKAMIERNGKEKLVFGDRVNKYDRRMTAQRRIFIMTDRAVYIIAIEKNMDKDKLARQKKPWIYVEKRRIEHNRLKTITLSPNADNFFAIHVPGEYDSLLETRRKTEFICTALKYNPGVSVQFSASINIVQKGGKKTTVVQFVRDQNGGANGTVKSKKVLVAPGMDKSSMPNLKAPSSVPTIASDPYGGMKSKGNPAPRGRGRGASNNVSPPSNTQAYSSPQPSYETQSYSAPSSSSSSSPQAKALYDFAAENADELTFHEGDIIDVLEQDGEWWKGSYNGQTGIFPYNYVEIIKKPTPSPNRGQTMTQPMRARGTANTGMPANRGVSNPSPNRGQTMAQPMTRGPSNPSPNRGQTMTAPMSRGVPSNRGQTMTAPGPNPGRMPMVMGMRGPPGRARGQ